MNVPPLRLKMGKSKRKSKLSQKAKENEIATRKVNIERNVKQFNKLIKNGEPATLQKQADLTDIYLDISADLDIIKGLDPKFAFCQVLTEQIRSIERYVKDNDDQRTKLSAQSKISKSSAQIAAAKLQAAEVDAEIQALHRVADDERVLRELEEKLQAHKLSMQKSALTEKKQKVTMRQQFLEEHDLDEREEIMNALESSSHEDSKVSSAHDMSKVPVKQQAAASLTTSNASDMHILADSISKAMHSSRLPVPEPPVFAGNPLDYVDWEISFRTLVESSGIPDSDKIHYLKRYVTGPAKEAISGAFMLHSDKAYITAKQKLKERFGSSFAIAEAFRSKLNQWPKIKANDNLQIQKFADFLSQCATAIEQMEELRVLNDPQQIVMLMNKLPDWLANSWKRKVVKYKKANGKFPEFHKFTEFLNKESEILNDPTLTSHPSSADDSKQTKKQDKPKSTTHLSSSTTDTPQCRFCELENHEVTECRKLSRKSLDEKKKFVFENHLCFACLKESHSSKTCTNKATCQKCNGPHPTALHFDKPKAPQAASNNQEQTKPPTKAQEACLNQQLAVDNVNAQINQVTADKIMTEKSGASSRATCNKSQTQFGLSSMVVPVWLSTSSKPGREVLTYALLDTMSDTTFVTNNVVAQLGTSGTSTTLNLTTMTSVNKRIPCNMHTDLAIRGYDTPDRIKVPCAYTREAIPLDKSHIPTAEAAKAWSHLRPIADEIPNIGDVEVGILIGYDTSSALLPLRSIAGINESDPFAVKTRLGWCIVGNVGPSRTKGKHNTCNRIMTFSNDNHINQEPATVTFSSKLKLEAQNMPEQIIDLLQQDFKETKCEVTKHTKMSQDDKQFIEKLTDETKQTDQGFYSMPLPFKNRPTLPNNLGMAQKRLSLLQKKMSKNEKYCNDYIDFMKTIIEAGDAEIVPKSENPPPGSIWYIPHFGVYHPKKPSKIRVVFDCSARFQDTCLNDHLLQGPDLLNSLVGVLHRFRKGKIAIMCDIERMFHRFKVHEPDRNYLRFLWFRDSSMSEVVEYRMTVHLFGATSSPGCATFGLRQVASDNHDESDSYSKQAVEFIKHDFYVDDGLISLDSQQEAIGVITKAIDICSKGNLRLHKFVCNDETVLSSIPYSEQTKNVKDLDLHAVNSTLPVQRALGVEWCVESDQFQFKVTLKNQMLTRRGILSTIASVFDPLGFIAPFVLMGKQILQEMCRDNLAWDDPLPDHLRAQWDSWLHDLVALQTIKIKRCLIPPGFGEIASTELHHFSDASTLGYGQCSYIRYVNTNKEVHCTLLFAKSRVTPLKQVTIPRAELQAAVLAAKVADNLKTDLKLTTLTKEVFWTDSKVVLGYIHNEARRFHVYVANRVQQIRDTTSTDQWKFISTKNNPADIASRGATISKLVGSCWFTGPAFLWSNCIETNPDVDFPLDPMDPEVKATCHNIGSCNKRSMTDRLKRFSSLKSAVRAISSLQGHLSRVQCMKAGKTKVEAFKHAKSTILQWAQQDELVEYKQAKQGTLAKSSALAKLDPFVDSTGLLRVGGRLQAGSLSLGETHPIILPKNSHVTQLVIAECHENVKHQGKGITMNEIRSAGYWIIGGNSVVASYIHNCIPCRRQRRPTENQKMAALPPERINQAPPFTYIGCDCFGPFIVKERRKEIKCYGVIFTCMASRAIHVELVDNMTTDAFLNALRCFIAIRGPIRQLRSDKGSNFVGAANELSKAMSESSSRLNSYANENHFDIVTNSPHSSHMGGVWERQIRSVRNVLSSILMNKSIKLDTNTLRTFLYEAMAIVNCRPLTTHHEDDPEIPLSPNQLLTMKSKVVLPPPGEFDQTDTYSRKRWRIVQGLANTFWSRWRKEYIQTLQVRQKWTTINPNIEVGDIVVLKEDARHRNDWPIARVVETLPSKDSLVRRVKLKIADSYIDDKGKRIATQSHLERPIHKVVLLYKPKETSKI